MNTHYPYLRGHCDEDCLGLGLDPVPKKTVSNVLRRTVRKPITYDNAFPTKNRALLSENQVNYVEGIIIEIHTANLGMSRKELIQVISELGQAKTLVQAENHLDYLIQVKRLTHLKSIGKVVADQSTTTERSQICVSQQYR